MKQSCIEIKRFINKEEEGSYFALPFDVPEGVERIDVAYDYARYITKHKDDGSYITNEVNIIDLGLNGAEGNYIGSSGSNRNSITISSDKSSQGFAPVNTKSGEWSIIVGAYKVQESGVEVTYHITFTLKELRLLKGDTHMHTLGSDGVHSVQGVAQLGKQRGLDYIIVTDHNNYAHNFQEVDVEGIAVIPGMEWTHYKGHAGLLGVKKPFESAFCVNSLEEAQEKLAEAKNNGALLVLNHPFCPNCGWKWGIDNFDYDAIEIWNGGLPIALNLMCMDWWHKQLVAGRKIPITGGSDFHRLDVASLIGAPCTCVYAMSNTQEDILHALKNGNSYISMFVKGPELYAEADGKILGDTVMVGSELHARFSNLNSGDVICIITDQEIEEIVCEESIGEWELIRKYDQAKFCRFEVIRRLAPELPRMKVLISNPIYFSK